MPKVSAIPGLKRLPKPDGYFTWYWAASQITRGMEDFRPRTARLWHGKGEPSPAELVAIGDAARRLSQDLEDWRLRARTRPLALKFRGDRLARRSPRGFIYFVRAGDRLKIGFTRNVKRRLSQLQTFFPEPLELLGAIPGSLLMEQEVHRHFGHLNITREWFNVEPELLVYIEKMSRSASTLEASGTSQNHKFQNRLS